MQHVRHRSVLVSNSRKVERSLAFKSKKTNIIFRNPATPDRRNPEPQMNNSSSHNLGDGIPCVLPDIQIISWVKEIKSFI